MLIIQAVCQVCGECVIFRNMDTIELDTAQNVRFGLEASDEANLSLKCPKCEHSNDFALIIEQDENYEID